MKDGQVIYRLALVALLLSIAMEPQLHAQSVETPSGRFKDLDDDIVGATIIVSGKQLFIDDHLIENMEGVKKVLNQLTKHSANPLIVQDRPLEGFFNRGSVMFDAEAKLFKMWYGVYSADLKDQALCYAVSKDGIHWEKPAINPTGTNAVSTPKFCNIPSVFLDPVEKDRNRRYKMIFGENPDGTSKSYSTGVAYSADGIHWTPERQNPLIPFSDTLSVAYWDSQRHRYVAYVRFGPPNTRHVSRIESEDFVHWSPKVTVIRPTKLDAPFRTQFYGMRVMPYEGVYIGLLTAYHGETIEPIPSDQRWMDRKDIQLAYSRNGLTWLRVGRHGAIAQEMYARDLDWATMAREATFLAYGEYGQEWDWGCIYPFQPPLVVGDEIWIYYMGHNGHNWWNIHKDSPTSGIGLARLRLDGFVAVEAGENEGTLTTKPLIFIGDALEINADAEGGAVTVEALDPAGNVIGGFSRAECESISTDSVRHVLKWRGSSNAQLLQARPIRLKFNLKNAKLFSFTPRVLHNHYIPS